MDDLFGKIGYEVFAIHLLLTSPTAMTKAWARTDTATKGDDAIQAHIPTLTNLSADGATALRDVARSLWPARAAFYGIGQIAGTDLYTGSEPHPEVDQANEILKRLRQL